MESITDEERRARLVARHHLERTGGAGDAASVGAGGTTPEDTAAAAVARTVGDLVAFHSTDPATPYLSAWARVPGLSRPALEEALLGRRTLVRLHAMRRTLFVVPSAHRGVFLAGAAREIAARERRRLEGWVSASTDGPGGTPQAVRRRLAALEGEVLTLLRSDGELLTRELSDRIPALQARLTLGKGRWAGETPLGSRLLLVMAMEGRIVRTSTAGSWRSSQYRWAAADAWFGDEGGGEADRAGEPPHARAALLARYLERFGPVTLDDIRWWTGWTVAASRAALRAVQAEPVRLDGGGEGWVPPNDGRGPPAAHEGSGARAALLPALDPTTMGWKERDWYLGEHGEALFDTNGNAGPTVWVDGRVVGGWAVTPDGQVTWRLLEQVRGEARDWIEAEAQALTRWLDGEVVVPRFRTPLERTLAGARPRRG